MQRRDEGRVDPKIAFIFPLARAWAPRHAAFATLLMSTGLTFGTISSLYGLNAGIITRTQFSLLITGVVLSAIVPTAIAQHFFQPREQTEAAEPGFARQPANSSA